jgi:hypothetical protein
MLTEEEVQLFEAGYIRIETNEETGEQTWVDLQQGGLDIIHSPLDFFRRFRVENGTKSFSTGGVDNAIRGSRGDAKLDSW